MTNQTDGTRSSAKLVFKKENQCSGKKRYDSELKAQRDARKLEKVRKGKRKVDFYLCTHCEYWHVGKMPTYYRGWKGHNESIE
mgnify:CR=1 FL=1|jgi:Cft2 family RNA processing exonuclease|tara:strand:+ start:3136 stop:3384 length:249 start_codon:yes stop_codon:yes gene_type:complete